MHDNQGCSQVPPALGEPPEATVRVTRYEVSCLPPDHPEHRRFRLTVEIQDRYGWTVHDGYSCYAVDGTPADGLSVYERTDEWIAAHRFDRDTALDLAKREAPKLTVNGWTVNQALEQENQ